MIKAAALSCALAWCLAVPSAEAAGAPLFPTPLHLTRQVHDSISGKTAVLEEYGYGNRLVSIRGSRTAIADYEKGELTEIDRDAGTYSVTRFDAVARANQVVNPSPSQAAVSATAAKSDRPLHSLGVKATKGGRSAEYFEAQVGGQEKVTVAVDHGTTLSKDALEVLVGAAFPNVHTGEHDVVLSAAAPSGAPAGRIAATSAPSSSDATYALPVEQLTSLEVDGQQIEFRSTVMRVGAEPPPAELVAIPAGARLVTSRVVEVANEIQQADHPSVPQVKH